MSLITLNTLKLMVNVSTTDTSMDAVLNQIIAGVEDWITNSFLRRAVLVKNTATPIVEYQDGWTQEGDDSKPLVLLTREWPVVAADVVELKCSGEVIPARADETDTGYYVDENGRGRIVIDGYGLPAGAGNIKLTYTPGYSTTTAIPDDILQADYMICVAAWNKRGLGGFAQSGVGNVSLQMKELVVGGQIDDALRFLMPHRRI